MNLGEGLEEIGKELFLECISLHEISIPPTVKAIEDYTFYRCSQLRIVNLGGGLEEIGWGAFQECSLLHKILVPPTVKTIKRYTFYGCSQLTTVNRRVG